MKTYLVIWSVEVESWSAEDAALKAYAFQQRPALATAFAVQECTKTAAAALDEATTWATMIDVDVVEAEAIRRAKEEADREEMITLTNLKQLVELFEPDKRPVYINQKTFDKLRASAEVDLGPAEPSTIAGLPLIVSAQVPDWRIQRQLMPEDKGKKP